MKKLTALLLAGAMAFSFAACDTDDDLGYISPTVTNMGEFDYAQTLSEIKVSGLPISLPCTMGDLGSGFTAVNGSESASGTMYTLKYNGKSIGNVRLNCSPDDKPFDAMIDYIEFNRDCDLKINGLSFQSTIDDVKKRFGEPSSSDFSSITYNGTDGQYIEFYHSGGNNQRIHSVRLTFKGE